MIKITVDPPIKSPEKYVFRCDVTGGEKPECQCLGFIFPSIFSNSGGRAVVW